MSNGQYCMQNISEVIEHLEKDCDVQTFCSIATDRIMKAYQDKGIIPEMKQYPHQRTTASAICYSKTRKEIWMVGDCQCLINGQLYDNPKPTETENASKRSDFIRKAIAEGVTITELRKHDTGRDYIYDDLITATQRQNIDYAVIDGFSVPMEKIKILHVNENDEIVLASDGYPILKSSLDESEKALTDILQQDPLCYLHFKATKGWMLGNKSFDDRAYIRFRI